MKKLRSKLIVVLLSTTLFSTTSIYAADYAYSIGTDYSALFHSDIDTSADAEYASTAYSLAGYSSYYTIKPTFTYLNGDNPSNDKRLESDIVFFSGHGNSQLMSFNYKHKGDDYATGIIQGKNWTSPSTKYKYVGIDEFNLNNAKIYIFAGCNTASGSDNITKDATTNGAQAAIGWYDSVGASSHSKWLKKFNDELAAGSTIARAKQFADSFSYDDSAVKKSYIYGDRNTTITDSRSVYSVTMDDRSLNCESLCLDDYPTIDDAVKAIFESLNKNIDNNYVIEKTSDDSIDVICTIDGIKTNSSYCILLDNNIVTAVYDNTIPIRQNFNNDLICSSINTIDEHEIFELAKEEISPEYTITNQQGELLYDANEETYKYHVLTDYVVNADNCLGRSEYDYILQ